jgi:hypothetical protein
VTRAKAIDKAQKLLALARDRGATLHEAEAARRRANMIMAAHGLDARDLVRRAQPAPAPSSWPTNTGVGNHPGPIVTGDVNVAYAGDGSVYISFG